MKGCFKLLLVLLLILSMVLSACDGFGTDGKETDTQENETSSGNAEECKHSETEIADAKAATCVSEGYSGDKVCKACGEVLEKGTVIAMLTEHSWDDGAITKNPTCATTGVKTFTCTVCHITDTETVGVVDCKNEYHFIADEAHALTCSVCFKTTNGEHTKSQLVSSSEANCLEGAFEIYHCDDCDSDFKIYDSTKPALGHAWDIENPVVTPATCSSEGEQYFVCKNANCTEKTEPVVLEVALGAHNYVLESRNDPTCSENGNEFYECTYCADGYNVTVGKVAHKYDNQTVDGAWTYSSCSVCGHSVSSFDASKSDNASILTDAMSPSQALEVNFRDASVEFDAYTVEQFKYFDSIDVNAGAIKSDIKDTIVSGVTSEEDKAILKADNAVIYDLGLNIDGEEMHEMYSKVTIKVPYTLSEDEDPAGIVILYVNQLGKTEEISGVAFSDEDGDGTGEVQFDVEHFSFYAVAYRETPAMRCRRGVHDYTNEELWKKVEPTCGFVGYTVKICRTCGHTTFDNYVAAKEHEFGEKVTPAAACDRGLYAYQECKNCNYVKNHEYIPPTGHKVANQATCDVSAVCSTCHKVLTPAYGHNWTEWTVIKEASATETGLKRRNCPLCGEIEDVKLPKISDVEAWDIDSFSDLINLVLRDALEINNGKLSFKMVQGEQAMTCDVTLNVEGESEIIEIKASLPAREDTYYVYYKDGALVAGEGEFVGVTNVDQLAVVFSDFAEIFDLFKSAFEYYEAYISEGIDISGALLDEYIEVFGETIDAELKANGYEYTSKEFKDAFNSLKSVYIYLANKLGVSTVCEMPEGAELPNAEDIHKVLEVFMEKSEANGNTTYTYDVSKVKALIDDVIKECESYCEKKLSEVCFEAYGPAIKAHLPEVTDWNKLMEYLRREFGGKVKVSTVIDKLLNFVESSEAMTKDELFDMLDKALATISGTEFDTEALVKEYGEKTIDQLLSEVYGDEMTVSKLYDELNKYMTETKLGDTVVDSHYEEKYDPETGYYDMIRTDVTYRERLVEIKEAMENILLKGNVSITLDADGKIVDFKVGGTATDAEGHPVYPEISLTFDRNNVKIEIPENVKKYFDVSVKFDYDADGNLVISGVPSDAENLDVWLQGKLTVDLADCVVLDEIFTKIYGFNIYALKDEYCTNEKEILTCAVGPDGKLYSFTHIQDNTHSAEVVNAISYSDFIADPMAYLPGEDDDHYGTYYDNGEEILVYKTAVGICYQKNGVWMIATYYNGTFYDNGEYKEYKFNELVGVEYASIFSDPKISSLEFNKYYSDATYNGEKVEVGELYFYGPEGDNLRATVAIIGNEIYFVEVEDHYDYSTRLVILGEITDVPEYDRLEIVEGYTDDFYIDGEVAEEYSYAHLYKTVPTYYAEYDGYFFNINDYYYGDIYDSLIGSRLPFVKANVSKLETHTLPDGRPVYVSQIEGDIETNGTVYGYILVNGEWYVQAACEYKSGALDGIYYRKYNSRYSSSCASKYETMSASSFIDVADYMTKDADGKITISAKMIELIENSMHDTFNSALISVSFGGEKEDLIYAHMIGMGLPETFDPETFDPSGKNIDWDNYFGVQGSEDSKYSFTVNVNDDGSITINAENGSELKVDFSFDMNKIEASDVVKYSPILSEKYGFDVYTATSQDKTYVTLALYNGKYYSVQEVRAATEYTPMSPDEILKQGITLQSADHQFDEYDDNGQLISRIYRGSLEFHNTGYSYTHSTIYLKIVDGQIYVLTGISEATDITLQYEGQVLLSEFLDGLKLVEQSTNIISDFLDSDNNPLGGTSFAIMYGDEYISHFTCYYLNDGNRTYVYVKDYDYIDVPVLDSPANLPAGWKKTSSTDEVFNGMKYQVIRGYSVIIDTDMYAFVGDSAVSIEAYAYSNQDVLHNIADVVKIVAVLTEEGWEYYSDYTYGENGLEYYNKLELPDDACIYYNSYISDNVYSYDYYDPSTVDVYEMSNGVKVYARKGSTDECYARLKDDMNINGYLVLQDDGSYRFKSNWYGGSFSQDDVVEALKLYDLIKIDGAEATISPEILEKLAKYSEHVRIYIRGDDFEYLGTVGYEEFASWFVKN